MIALSISGVSRASRPGDVALQAGENIHPLRTQQRIEDRLVEFGRAVTRGQRRNVGARATRDLMVVAGRMQAERGIERMLEIKVAREMQRAAQLRHGLIGRELSGPC